MRRRTLDARCYTDPAIYAAEREAVFAASWQLVAASRQLPRKGDTLALTVAGWPLLLARGDDGVLRGFHNVCRHRAGPMLWDGQAEHCRVLRCRYHGWQYDLRGRLIRTPGFGAEVGETSLFSVACEEWRGLVFVHLRPEAAPSLASFLGSFVAEAAGVDFEGLQVGARARHELACNWKTYVENYLEGYHIPYLHRSLSREVDIDAYEVRAADRHVVHLVPTKGGATYDGFWAWLWPNVALNVYNNGMSIERIVPTGGQTMAIEYVYLFDDLSDEAAARRAASQQMSHDVTREDIQVCEAVQRNLAAGVYRSGELSPRHERGVGHFQQLVREALGGLVEESAS